MIIWFPISMDCSQSALYAVPSGHVLTLREARAGSLPPCHGHAACVPKTAGEGSAATVGITRVTSATLALLNGSRRSAIGLRASGL